MFSWISIVFKLVIKCIPFYSLGKTVSTRDEFSTDLADYETYWPDIEKNCANHLWSDIYLHLVLL